MKLAYLVQAHKNSNQIELLLKSLNNINTDFFIHIDKKSDCLFQELKRKFASWGNVFLVEDRVTVNWSSFTQVQATLKLLEVATQNQKYDYLSLISGQDYPIKNNLDIIEFLTQHKNQEFIEVKEIGQYRWRIKGYNLFTEFHNNRKLYIKILDNLFRMAQKHLIRRNNLKDLDLYMGSSWFTITHNCALYILEYIRKNPSYIYGFKYTACSDEHFFQILIMNSKFKSRVVNNNLRYIIWEDGKSSPRNITSNDLKSLLQSDKLFARKFDILEDKEVIEQLNNIINID